MIAPSLSSHDGTRRVRAIAYYLPQYHPIPENDAWWGKGFTEWTNVIRAKPLFAGHYQPHLPTDFGFYDLRVAEVREAQAALARANGLHGFCYYYYWFGRGRRLLERPLREVLDSGKPDFPFCVCWANESWSRRWDGAEAEVLIDQDDSESTYLGFIDEILPFLLDPRYIRVGGRPLVLVYRVGRIPDAQRVAASWREAAVRAGLPGLYLAAVQSHDGEIDPRPYGFDAAVEFPPSPWKARQVASEQTALDSDFHGRLFDYDDLVRGYAQRDAPDYRLLRGVMTSWDNTARKGPAAFAFPNATPRAYESWLRATAGWTEAHNPPDEQVLFVNAWNEWAEGAHLEPDQRHGHAWLDATARALSSQFDWNASFDLLGRFESLTPEMRRQHLADLRFAVEAEARARATAARTPQSRFEGGMPRIASGRPVDGDVEYAIERLKRAPPTGRVALRQGEELGVTGWCFAPGLDSREVASFLMLQSPNGDRRFVAPIPERRHRDDVSFQNRRHDERITLYSGFEVLVDTSEVDRGEYRLGFLQVHQDRMAKSLSNHRIVVE